MSRFVMYCIAATAFAFGTAHAERIFTDEQWRQDIETYVSKLKTMHKNPFHAVPEPIFQNEVDALAARLGELSDQQIALEMSRLAAMIGDGHTWIAPDDSWAPERVPVTLFEFEDGVFVRRAMPKDNELVGREVIAIGGRPVDELLTLAGPFTSRDNEYSLRARRTSLLTNVAFLERVDIMGGGPPVFTLRDAAGNTSEAPIEPVDAPRFYAWLDESTSTNAKNLPLFRRRADEPYWTEYLDENRALYMRFNSVLNAPNGPHLTAFSEHLVQQLDETGARKLIIDVRNNGGGNGDLLKPLIRRISENKRINQRGRLFVLCDRITYSAALMFTVRMDLQTNALFAGEPGGGKPNSYSERTDFTLPNTKMVGSISSRYHEEGGPGDDREFVPVDIPVEMTSADYFGNRDPVLDAVLAYRD